MKFIISSLLLNLLLVGCAGPKIQLPPAPEAEVLLRSLARNNERWQQLDAAAKIALDQHGKYMSTQDFLLLEKPDRLRLDVLSLFNQLALQLAVDQGELQVFLNTSAPGQYYRGPASDELLARFTRVPLGVVDLVRLLLYDPPTQAYQTAAVEVSDDRYLLRLTNGDRQQQFFFDRQLQLRRGIYLSLNEPFLIVNYDKQNPADGFPRRIQIEMPKQETSLTVTLSEVRLNVPAKAGRFQLSFPANATPLELPGLNTKGEG
ncbi:DUF4292 domain-containing protein [Geopsychrobacter electrodiphilus]|uniref:DUF4292 domain-containing protein n=1 Tax=Geopsychrobacter electrodiphilus TaxID=225196 RepID=UPI00035C2EA6|nr:DUF4292 domain-containing protein [Geopsychrobacter electrodiphilus]